MVWNVPMNSSQLLIDAFSRVSEAASEVLDGAGSDVLTLRLDPDANTIAWLVWHLTRVQDDHVAKAFDGEQLWTSQGWADRFDLPFDVRSHGYGQASTDVAQVRSSAELLLGYLNAVQAQTVKYLETITDADLDRIVDERWHPPVTLGVRLVSVISDCLQHAGQAAFIRGVADRR
jgi:hypothetical protein